MRDTRIQTTLYSLLLLMAGLQFCGLTALADVTSSVHGTVVDRSGAAIVGATVTLRSGDTGFNRQVATDSTGGYEFLSVPIGEHYGVVIEAKGFQTFSLSDIKLLVNQNFTANFQLKVGAVIQVLKVKADSVQVDTSSNQLGDVIGADKMTSVPLNGRSFTDLLGLQAGVVPVTSGSVPSDRPVSGDLNPGNVSVNGQRETGNGFFINGNDAEEARNNGTAIIPTLDSIQEFRVLTNTFDAEYGGFSGSIVNVITKSGTNQFHGDVYEFLRNTDLDARNYFDLTRGAFKQNQFGGTIGGPSKKNRAFFFADYQGTRQIFGISTGTIPVPSASERNGDFSDVGTTGFPPLTGTVRGGPPGSGGMNDVLTSRLGYTVNSGEPYWVQGCNTLGQAQTGMCVFPGQQIPQSAWDSAAKGTLKYIPASTGNLAGKPIFSSGANSQNLRDDKFGTRFDFDSKKTGMWSAYYYFDDSTVLSPYTSSSNIPGFPANTPSRAQLVSLSNTKEFGTSAVNEARLAYTRLSLLLDQPQGGLSSLSSLGFTVGGLGINSTNPKLEGMPPVQLAQTGVSFGLPGLTTRQVNNTFEVEDNFSKIVNQHTLQFGGEFRDLQIDERNTAYPNGLFQFFGGETGNDFADYLIGAPDAFNQSSQQFLDSRGKYVGLFAEDSYRAAKNLTLNYGVRWDFIEPFYDTQNRLITFLPGKQSQLYTNAPTGLVFAGEPGVPRTLTNPDYHSFAPRIGVAYSPSISGGLLGRLFGGPGKTSIRMGYGIFYTSIEDLTLFYQVGAVPWGLYYVSPTLDYLDQPYQSRLGSSHNPGQRFPFITPAPGSASFANFQPVGTNGLKYNNTIPYGEDYNLTIQRQIGASTILSIGYVGTQGHHLLSAQDFNPGSAARCLQIRAAFAAAGQPGQGCGPFGEDSIYTVGGQTFYGTRPYSVTSGRYLSQGLLDFAESEYYASISHSAYNSMQVTLNKQAGPVRFLAAYTWSKAMDNASGIGDFVNPFNPAISYALSTFNMTHNFVTSYTSALPFGHLGGSATGALHKVLAGWQMSGITRFTTGFPVTTNDSGDLSLVGSFFGGVDRPNYNGQSIKFLNPRHSANHIYFDPSPFSPESLGEVGNANRRFFHGPGLDNWDMALLKTTQLSERTSLEFRAEYFNIFNHAQFLTPSGDINSPSTFGVVTGARDPRIGQMALKLYF